MATGRNIDNHLGPVLMHAFRYSWRPFAIPLLHRLWERTAPLILQPRIVMRCLLRADLLAASRTAWHAVSDALNLARIFSA